MTAEQVVANLESAPSRIAILDRLLEGLSLNERRRLLLKVIPKHHFEQELFHARLITEMEEDGYVIAPLDQTSLEKGFRLAFDTAPDELKRDVVANLITILKEDSESKILSYERAFFKMSDLKYCSPDDAKLVKEHILSVLPNHYQQILPTLDGIEDFLYTEDEATGFVDILMKVIQQRHADGVISCIENIRVNLPGGSDISLAFFNRVNDWVKMFHQQGRRKLANPLRQALGIESEADNTSDTNDSDDEIPF